MKIKLIIFYCMFSVYSITSFSQRRDSLSLYKLIVKEFYYDLLKKRFVSISDCVKLFHSTALEYDEYLFLQSCNKSNNEKDCLSRGKERYQRPSSYESLLFNQFKKQKLLLTKGQDDQIDSLILGLKMHSKGIAELPFSNGVILFAFSNPEFEDLYLTDIFLSDGASIFNYVEGTHEKHYFK